jgi:hypothetical protein
MVIKFAELYVESRSTKKGCSNCKGTTVPTKYGLREVFVNPSHVVCIRPEDKLKNKMLTEEVYPEGLHEDQGFTRIYMNRGQVGLDMVVVGSADTVEAKLFESQKKLLRG